MMIAVTYENGQVFQHFGQTKIFKLYTTADADPQKVISTELLDCGEYSHESLVTLLLKKNVEVLICGGIGPGAQNVLSRAGIELRAACTGDADEKVEQFLNGTLEYSTSASCHDHHHHDHDHSHEHGCSHH